MMDDVATLSSVEVWLDAFSRALASGDATRASQLFDAEECFWRDMLAFTWDIRTLEGRAAIVDMLSKTPAAAKSAGWRRAPRSSASSNEGMIEFQTASGRGRGYVRLRGGKCRTLFTCLEDLTGFEEPRGRRRPKGTEINPVHPDMNWQDLRRMEAEVLGRSAQPYVLIVGGGQGGLALAARLRQLQVPTLVVDRWPRVGDQWRSRYKSLSLHDPVWYDHLPYLPFPDTWPVFTPKDKIADWLEAYAELMELDVWTDSECVSASWDDNQQGWTVAVRRGEESITLHPKQLVIATGNAGKPVIPPFAGQEAFEGSLRHSSHYTGGAEFRGRRVAVIGSNNSAQDICADLVAHGVDVTMIQRDSTHVIRSETFIDVLMRPLYSEDALEAGVTTEFADFMSASMPLRLLPEVYRPLYETVAARDADFYARLEAVGFMHDFGEDGTGMPLKYLRRASGYYIDVGASDLIASGEIKLRSRVTIDHLESDGVVLSDGHKVIVDDVICATGFGTMDQWAADLISPDVAQRVGRVWGYGSDTAGDPGPWEGELRNMWKPTRQPGLWFHGGNLAQSRFYSKILAMQLKARQAGLPVAVYDPAA